MTSTGPRRLPRAVAALALALAPLAAPALLAQEQALATPPPAASPPAARGLGLEERRRELAALKRRLSELRGRLEATRRKEADLAAALEAAGIELELKTSERRVLELKEAEAERAVTAARRERDEARAQVESLKSDVAARLDALYRMGRLGYFQAVARADSGAGLLRALQLMSFLVERDSGLLRRFEGALTSFQAREQQLLDQQRELAALSTEAAAKQREVERARAEQAQLLARARRAGAEQKTAVERLEDKTVRLAALLELLEAHGRVLPPGAASIRRFKGVLDWPAKGRVTVPFGRIENPRFPKTFLRSSGWTLDVAPGTEVRAVFAGDVAFAQWMKGYGNLVVLDHGEGIFTLYAHLATGTATRGTRVGLGEPVGRVAEAPAEEEAGGLYFEVRDARASCDPKEWLR